MQQRLVTYLVFLLMVLPLVSFGQRRKVPNLKNFDNRKFHFGFSLGYNEADFRLDRKAHIFFPDSLLAIEPVKAPGFNLTIVSQWHVTKNLGLRFLPGLSFQDRVIRYTFVDGKSMSGTEVVDQRVESTFIHFPLNVKFRSNRVNNFAAYIVAGGRYSVDMASQQNANQGQGNNAFIKQQRMDWSYDAGAGFDFFLPYFKFGIELKSSFGIPDVLIQDNTMFSTPLDRLRTKLFILSFTFEG